MRAASTSWTWLGLRAERDSERERADRAEAELAEERATRVRDQARIRELEERLRRLQG